ncbi:MAG TPA: hypothetical protein VMU54_24775 [Planctomycetota bacterium]|nr:hypothetical protein [Planctomycetota bacterium]
MGNVLRTFRGSLAEILKKPAGGSRAGDGPKAEAEAPTTPAAVAVPPVRKAKDSTLVLSPSIGLI